MPENDLLCDDCFSNLTLATSTIVIKFNETIGKIDNFPVFFCKNCGKKYPSEMALKFLKVIIDNGLEILNDVPCKNIMIVRDFNEDIVNRLKEKVHFPSTLVDFDYSKSDYFFIPGVQRDTSDGYLTPVFFNIEVLLKYMHHPSYGIDIGSDTYGIINKDSEFSIPFGINDNNHVILWLGDIAENLDEQEQHYLKSENIPSDHSIKSEFYDAQINVQWGTPSQEKELLKNRFEFNNEIQKKFKLSVSQLELETVQVAKQIKKMVVNTEEAFRELILPLNKVLVESINSKAIKSSLNQIITEKDKEKYKDLKGLKLMQIWLERNTCKINVAMELSPLFVLYDLRILVSHLQSEQDSEKLKDSCCERLNLCSQASYLEIANRLIERLNKMFITLKDSLI